MVDDGLAEGIPRVAKSCGMAPCLWKEIMVEFPFVEGGWDWEAVREDKGGSNFQRTIVRWIQIQSEELDILRSAG